MVQQPEDSSQPLLDSEILHGPATLVPRESAHTCTHSRQCANTPHKQSYLKKKVMYLSNFSVHENYPKLT